jgi:hypothetical protein
MLAKLRDAHARPATCATARRAAPFPMPSSRTSSAAREREIPGPAVTPRSPRHGRVSPNGPTAWLWSCVSSTPPEPPISLCLLPSATASLAVASTRTFPTISQEAHLNRSPTIHSLAHPLPAQQPYNARCRTIVSAWRLSCHRRCMEETATLAPPFAVGLPCPVPTQFHLVSRPSLPRAPPEPLQRRPALCPPVSSP